MKNDGGSQPGKGSEDSAMCLNGRPSAVTRAVQRIACNASHQGIGSGKPVAMNLCTPLHAKRHQCSSGVVKPPGRKQNLADRLNLMGDWRDSFAAMI